MVFDSRNEAYKTPFGAVSCGTGVTITLRPEAAEGFSRCFLVTHAEFSDQWQETELSLREDGSFHGVYTAPASADLVWYFFRFSRENGDVLWGKNGYCSSDPVPYQLTVYAPAPVPSWFGRGVTYQIFPDRFFRTANPSPYGMVGHRTVHENWDDTPVYLPDTRGEITNSDFFGGSLAGITEKLDYLRSLGVTTLYLCPIFESASNHRYDTADYLHIDPMLGTEEDFRALCEAAKARDMHVMLDGVFNHTGSVSRYFNADGYYPELGAAQSPDSPYASWYSFHPWPWEYDAWWGIKTLPAVNETNEDYRRYIITGEDSVVRHWLRAGADAWRLDVADELPDDFIAELRRTMLEEKPDSFLLGEVWEDASNKIAYSRRRRYFLGEELCGVMNYPFRTAAIAYLTGGNAAAFRNVMEDLRENYPPAAYASGLNILGTHDTPRILTVLGADRVPESKAERAAYRLSPEELSRGMARLSLGVMLTFTFVGSPTVFYGDEVGMQGFEDPLNRGTYPWGRENEALLSLYRTLGHLRKTRRSLQEGALQYIAARDGLLVFARTLGKEVTLTALNAADTPAELSLPWAASSARDVLTSQQFLVTGGELRILLPPRSGMVLI